MSMIRVENITFSYPSSFDPVFENVSFQIDTEWKLGLVGRNGRGKTTLLKLLLGEYEYRGKITGAVTFDYFPFPVSDKTQMTEDILRQVCPNARQWELIRELSYLGIESEVLWRPIIFQAGLSMENNSLAKYCRPIEFEEVLSKYPEVNICLSHVGWPWVQETAALLLKYENCYTNTALMNFDGPYQIYKKFTEDMGALWVEHNIADKIMFGSGSPRIRPVRSKRGLDSLGFSEETLEKIYAENAERFLGRE